MFPSLTFKHNLYQPEGKIATREQPFLAYVVSSGNLEREDENQQQCKKVHNNTAHKATGLKSRVLK